MFVYKTTCISKKFTYVFYFKLSDTEDFYFAIFLLSHDKFLIDISHSAYCYDKQKAVDNKKMKC